MGFGWLEVGYSGVTFPLVEPCLQHAAKLGYKRIVVFPYFLFTGILIDRIYGFTDRVAEAHPGIQFVKAGYLNDHPKVLETFAERVTEQLGTVPPRTAAPAPTANRFCRSRAAVTNTSSRRIEPGILPSPTRRRPPASCANTGSRFWGSRPRWAPCRKATTITSKGRGVGARIERGGLHVLRHLLHGECRLHLHDHHHHDHDHGHHHHHHGHDHGHHHAEYPHAKHPHGPESARSK